MSTTHAICVIASFAVILGCLAIAIPAMKRAWHVFREYPSDTYWDDGFIQ